LRAASVAGGAFAVERYDAMLLVVNVRGMGPAAAAVSTDQTSAAFIGMRSVVVALKAAVELVELAVDLPRAVARARA